MKKFLLSLSLLMMLCACSNASDVKVSNGDEVIWSSSKETYTSQDLFDDMKKNDYSSKIVTSILNKTAVLDGIDTTSTDEELFERAYKHLKMKFGENGYAKFFFKDEEYENFLKEIRELLLDKEKFIHAQRTYINELKNQGII